MSTQYPSDSYNPYQEPSYQEPAYRESAYQPPAYQPPLYQQPWGVPYVAPPIIVVAPPTSGKAIASMVLGICLALTLCSFLSFAPVAFLFGLGTGIPAVILGHQALRKIRESNGSLGGQGMAVAGLVLGYISIGAALIAGLITIFFVLLFFQTSTIY